MKLTRRILSAALCIALLIGLFPGFRAAAAEPAAYHPAAYAESVTLDGTISETAWAMSGLMTNGTDTHRFGFLWNSGGLYLAMDYVPKALTLVINGVTITDTPSACVDVIELFFPAANIGLTVTGDHQTVPVKIGLGDCIWEGDVVLQPLNRGTVPNLELGIVGSAANLGYTASGNNYRMWNKHNGAAANGGRVYVASINVPALANDDQTVVVEFDFTSTSMPVVEPAFINKAMATTGWNLALIASETSGYSVGISNTADGLALVALNTAGTDIAATVPLGKEVGDTFHFRMDYDTKDKLKIYVDDVLIETLTSIDITAANWITGNYVGMFNMNLYADASVALTADGANDMDMTVSRLVISTMPTVSENPLDDLTFDTIKGGNTREDFITFDLELPASVANHALTWDSSKPDVIDPATGKVTRPDVGNAAVTLTATLANGESKSFNLTVIGLTQPEPEELHYYAAFSSAVALDGKATDIAYVMDGKLTDGTNEGKFGFIWDKNNLYLALEPQTGGLKLVINGVTITDTASASGEVIELRFPFSNINLAPSSYDVSFPVELGYGDLTWEGTVHLDPTTRNTIPNLPERGTVPNGANLNYTVSGNSYHMWNKYNGSEVGGGRVYIASLDVPLLGEANKIVVMDFDFKADSMPVIVPGDLADWTTTGLNMIIVAGKEHGYRFGICNTTNGLYFVLSSVSKGSIAAAMPLGKTVGETFHLRTEYDPMAGTMDVFVDEALVASLTGVGTVVSQHVTGQFTGMINMNLWAEPDVILTADGANNMDMTVSNLKMGLKENGGILANLSFDDIRGSNSDPERITSDLVLPTVLPHDMLTLNVSWSSSDPDVIDPETGKVTLPATGGAIVTLTATLPDGASKEFRLIVIGQDNTSGNVLVVEWDENPASGAGRLWDDFLFTLDATNNSVILDLEQKQAISVVKLIDTDTASRLNAESLTLWVSDDNAVYTRVDSFKLLHLGTDWYLYDFAAEGRYVKVHYTHFEATDASFKGIAASMIEAFDDALLANGGSFVKDGITVTNTTEANWQDEAVTLDGEFQRVLLNGEILYHYVENGKTVVRIPDLKAGSTAYLEILTGNENAIDISNKENVYEVTYGTRESFQNHGGRVITTLPAGMTFPDGSVQEQEVLMSVNLCSDPMYGQYKDTVVRVSYDNGYTWEDFSNLRNNAGYDFYKNEAGKPLTEDVGGLGGWIIDWNTGRIMYHTHILYKAWNSSDFTLSDLRVVVLFSDDGGKTWNEGYWLPRDVENDPYSAYVASYNDGIMLSTYDGDGPNVDFVFNQFCIQNNYCAGAGRVAYSCDAGQTWTFSESLISYGNSNTHEGNISECTILERDDGTLVLYARCEYEDVVHLAKSYSYDHGVTWTDPVLADIYSVNTQPIMLKYDMDGNGADETPMIFWGGNNAFGAKTTMRAPLSIAKSEDGMETFVNIQNAFLETFMETYTKADDQTADHFITNPSVTQIDGDGLYVTFYRLTHHDSIAIRFDDFVNWFNRTKGIYDSFEHGTIEYEGWEIMQGATALTDIASDGSSAMQVSAGSKITRSVPYLQDGVLSFDLCLDGTESFTIELQPACSDDLNHVGVFGLEVQNGQLTFYGSENTIALEEGWNTITMDLNLTSKTASGSVNGSEPETLDVVATDYYACYLTVFADDGLVMDNILLIDNDAVAEAPASAEIAGTTMTLGNDLALNFVMEAAKVNGEGLYAEIVHGDKVTTIDQADWIVSGNYVKIAYTGLAAKQMTDEVTITIYDADGNELDSKTDSIRDYAMRMFGKSGDDFDTVLADMLNYGAAAQLQFNYKTDDLANSLMTEEQKAKATESIELSDIRKTASGYQGATLSLENNIVLNFFYSADFVGKTATVSYTDHYGVAHEYEAEVVASGSMGKVSVDKLVISDCSVAITVTIDGEAVVDSVESYCARMTTLALREPLMKFASSASAYFNN